MTHDDLRREEFFKNAWRQLAGRKPITYGRIPDLAKLRQTEWSADFERLMRNRLVMGAIRYGKIGASGKPRYDRIGRAIKELALFRQDGNTERLVDVANMMLLIFAEGEGTFKAQDGGLHNEPK